MPVTQKDIARALQVSVMAVHRALNDAGYVSRPLKERIRAYAAQVNYRPHRGAQALVRNRLRRLALFSVASPSFFWDEMDVGFRTALEQVAPFGYVGTYHRVEPGDTGRYLRQVQEALRGGAEAVAVVNNYEFEMERVFSLLEKSGVPYITFNIDAVGSGRACFIGPDYPAQGHLAADFLGKMLSGRGRVVILFSEVQSARPGDAQGISTQRMGGFMEYARTHFPGVTCEVRAVDHTLPERTIRQRILSSFTRARGLNAVFCVPPYSLVAARCLRDCGKAGKVPMVTFDLYSELKELIRSDVVTGTICQKPVQQGYYAVRMLEQLLENKSPIGFREFHISSHLVVKANVDVEEDLLTVSRLLAGPPAS